MVATAAKRAFGSTGTSYVHTGGVWVSGFNPNVTEETPFTRHSSPPGDRQAIQALVFRVGSCRVGGCHVECSRLVAFVHVLSWYERRKTGGLRTPLTARPVVHDRSPRTEDWIRA